MSKWVDQRILAAAILAGHGEPPWPCDYCGEPVEPPSGISGSRNGVFHHKDEDRTNNDPSNVVPMHRGCHRKHHQTGKPFSEERKAAISAAKMGHRHSDEARAKMSAAAKARAKR